MKKILLLAALMSVFCSTNVQAERWDEIEFYSNGESHKLADYKGKTVLVLFWATWCPYCKSQLPALSMLKTLYSNVPDFEVLNISTDDEGEEVVKNYLNTYNLNNLNSYIDINSNLLHSLGFSAIPTLVLISAEGEILGNYSGLQDLDIKYLEGIIKKDG